MDRKQRPYNYGDAGYNRFLKRSIENNGVPTSNLSDVSRNVAAHSREINFEQSRVSGSMGDTARIGKINLDGTKGRISVYDDDNNEVMRIGELDG